MNNPRNLFCIWEVKVSLIKSRDLNRFVISDLSRRSEKFQHRRVMRRKQWRSPNKMKKTGGQARPLIWWSRCSHSRASVSPRRPSPPSLKREETGALACWTSVEIRLHVTQTQKSWTQSEFRADISIRTKPMRSMCKNKCTDWGCQCKENTVHQKINFDQEWCAMTFGCSTSYNIAGKIKFNYPWRKLGAS